VVLRWPVRELVRSSAELERVAEFELRDGRITAFTTRAPTP
jgi:hypothetical protein